MRIAIALCLAILSGGPVFGNEEHPLSTIQGASIDLKTYDHAIAGAVRDFVIWGNVNESSFESELVMKRDGQVVRTVFGKKDGIIGGTIRHASGDHNYETSIIFDKLDRDKNTFHLKINGEPIEVAVQAIDFVSNHFIKPTYSTVVHGKKIEFTLNGQACYAYSLHLIFLIVGASVH